ncbi:unnamed protein product, partial [Nesidiocoris tenuis]
MRENLELMYATVRLLQRRVENIRTLRTLVFSEEMASFVNEEATSEGDSLCRELGRLVRRNGWGADVTESDEDGRIAILGEEDSNMAAGNPSRWLSRVPIKR